MTLFQLPPRPVESRSVEDRLDAIEADVAVIVKGIETLLSEIVAMRARWDAEA